MYYSNAYFSKEICENLNNLNVSNDNERVRVIDIRND